MSDQRNAAENTDRKLRRQLGFELLSIFKGASTESIDDAVERVISVCTRPTLVTDELVERLRDALKASDSCLRELLATVEGECPSLLDEDSGGSARLDMDIEEALLKSAVALGKCPSCRSPREWVPSELPPRPCKTPSEHIPQDSWHPNGLAKYNELVRVAALAAMPTLGTGQLEGECHVKAAYRETLKRYPEAVKALAFFWSASGLGAGEVTAEHIEWARSVLAHPQPGPSQ